MDWTCDGPESKKSDKRKGQKFEGLTCWLVAIDDIQQNQLEETVEKTGWERISIYRNRPS